MRRRASLGSELGAEAIQLAVTMPVMFVLAMTIVQLCLMSFYVLTLSSEADQAAWEVNVETLEESGGASTANALVKEAILKRAIALDADSLTVEGANYETSPEYSQHWENDISDKLAVSDDDKGRYYLGTVYHDTTAGLLQFDVSYTLPSIINLPCLSNVTVTRHVACERVLQTRTEVG